MSQQKSDTFRPGGGFFPSITKTVHYTAYPAIDITRPELSVINKVVVVTGGGRGIGRAIASHFAAAGAKTVAIIGRTQSSLDETKSIIESEALDKGLSPAEVLTYPADITDAAAIKHAFADIKSSAGPIDVFVNNASILGPYEKFSSVDIDKWWKTFEVNVRGSVLASRAFLENAGGNATLINVSSAGIHVEDFGSMSAYLSSKWSVVKALDCLIVENPSIRLFHIQPGVVATELGADVGTIVGRDDASLPASFAVWLASPESEFLRGRFIWSNWDIEELKSMKNEIMEKDLLRFKLEGWDANPGVLKYR